MRTRIYMHTCIKQNVYPGEFDEKTNRSTEKQIKIEEESKNTYEKFRGEFPILKFQADLSKKSKTKSKKVSRKVLNFFSILFFEKKS